MNDRNDMRRVITPRSDQLNTDDLIGGPRTIRITKVTIANTSEQPVSVFFEGDNNKPWRPCKSMCRLLVAAWGPDASVYTGRSVTLFRDPTVLWAGLEVGGIRISHMSHLERDIMVALTVTRGKRAPFMVKMLREQKRESQPPSASADTVSSLLSAYEIAASFSQLDVLRERVKLVWPNLEEHQRHAITEAANVAKGRLAPPADAGDAYEGEA